MKRPREGQSVAIRISDPWEVSQAHDWPVDGRVLRIVTIAGGARRPEQNAVLLQTDVPVRDFSGSPFSLIIAYPRYAGERVSLGHEIVVNYAGLTEMPDAEEDLNPRTWRRIGHGTLLIR